MDNELLVNLDKLHTTEMGVDRIKRNLQIDVFDVHQMSTLSNSFELRIMLT